MSSSGLSVTTSFKLLGLIPLRVRFRFPARWLYLMGVSGIPNVIDSYAKFRNLLKKKSPDLEEEEHPQLLICGHGAVDDPDASIIYDQVMQLINSEKYNAFSKDIVVMRLPPSDQRKPLEKKKWKLLS